MSGAIRFGVYLPAFGPFGEPTVLVDLAIRAEAAGWDGVFLWDHVVTDDGLPIADSFTCLGAMAQATQRLRLGTMVTPLPRRRPWLVARQAAAISRLSGGRFILGVGLGSDEFGDFSRFGEHTELSVRSAMLDEALDIVRAMWSGRPYQHNGRYYRISLDEGTPEPFPIPIWAASSAGGARAIGRAAAVQGFFPNPADREVSADELTRLLAAVHRDGLPQGQPYDVAIRGNASPAWPEPQHSDLDGLANAGMTWWMESLIHFDPLDLSLAVVDAGPPARVTAPVAGKQP